MKAVWDRSLDGLSEEELSRVVNTNLAAECIQNVWRFGRPVWSYVPPPPPPYFFPHSPDDGHWKQTFPLKDVAWRAGVEHFYQLYQMKRYRQFMAALKRELVRLTS